MQSNEKLLYICPVNLVLSIFNWKIFIYLIYLSMFYLFYLCVYYICGFFLLFDRIFQKAKEFLDLTRAKKRENKENKLTKLWIN